MLLVEEEGSTGGASTRPPKLPSGTDHLGIWLPCKLFPAIQPDPLP